MEINRENYLNRFKIKEDKTGWVERNELLGRIMTLTGHSYWAVRNKTKHLSIQDLSKIYYNSKNNPKKFYYLIKQSGN